jgi:hypothetical protein
VAFRRNKEADEKERMFIREFEDSIKE